jgi:hypothetical protein
MTLKKLALKGGINRERTRYASEGGWYNGDKIRFRKGMPEKIGGWAQISSTTFQGICRSIFNWVTITGQNFLGVGTNLKFFIENGGGYNDVTPLRATVSLSNPFTTTNGSTTVLVTDANGGFEDEDFVTFSGSDAVGGLTITGEFQIDIVSPTTYNITVSSAASSGATGGGTVSAAYQINTGPAFAIPLVGWGASSWGSGTWGIGQSSVNELRTWNQSNFGEDLVFGPSGGRLYFWDSGASTSLSTRAVEVSSLSGASDVPTVQNILLVSDNRFVFCFGVNEVGSSSLNPMHVRWSDQEKVADWTPSEISQSAGLTLSRGTEIVAAQQARQEILVWTDVALYSMQYVKLPDVWNANIVGENVSIASQKCVAYANGVAYWMGKGNFYKYDGRSQPLRCDVRRYVFNDFNTLQYPQVFAGSNEAFHEIWWFYCSSSANNIDKYVIYNYLEDTWYFGTLARTAWIGSGLRDNPTAATYDNNLVNHEDGVDDKQTSIASPSAITAFVESAEFDLNDGHKFAFVYKLLPDITFDGSTADNPVATFTLNPLDSSGSGINSPTSEGGSNSGTATRSATSPVEVYTDQVYTRVRGRQMSIKIESTTTGTTWQVGIPRIDLRTDGRR